MPLNPRTILSLFPASIREHLFYRCYNHKQEQYRDLFKEAPLKLAPDFVMNDLIVGDVISGQIALNGFYEYALSREIATHARNPGGLFVDVGANLGYFTLLWLHGNPDNRAIAVEASPRNQALLGNNLSRNQLEDRCQLIPKAAGDANQTVTFDLGPEDQTGWGGINSGISGTQSVEVEMVRLDSIISEPISVLKIDVEGADTLVIKGCEELLKKKLIRKIFFEQNPGRMEKLGIAPGEAQAFLESLDYACTPFGSDDGEWVAEPR